MSGYFLFSNIEYEVDGFEGSFKTEKDCVEFAKSKAGIDTFFAIKSTSKRNEYGVWDCCVEKFDWEALPFGAEKTQEIY